MANDADLAGDYGGALESAGMRAEVVFDPLQTLDTLYGFQPDLILMDMSLPGLDGWEASRRLKADPQTKDIAIIAITAHAMAGDREKALAAGCDEFDTKPIERTRLLAKIEALLARPGA